MKSKILGIIVIVGLIYLAWSLFFKVLLVAMVALGCYFIYLCVQAIKKNNFLSALKNLFCAYLLVVSASIMQGSLIVHWDNIYKLLRKAAGF